MAEAIGVASGLLGVATFAFESSITLYNTIQSFKSHAQRVSDLKKELEALSEVLRPLSETVHATTDVGLSTLKLPLQRCGNACKEFEQELLKCSSRSGGLRSSFRDWAKLKYMGEDMDSFRRLLAGYKLTITIALTDANLRKSSVTAEILENHKELIKSATEDLQLHLESIDEKLEIIFKQTVTESDSDATELRRMKEDRLSTQICLQICDQLSEHINQIQLTPKRSLDSPGPVDPDAFPERVTNEGLQECRNSLNRTALRLEKNMRDLMDRLIMKSKTSMTSEDEVAGLARLREEWETTRESMGICSKAENYLKETVSIIDNYATGDDAIQFMVSTNGKSLHGRNEGRGWRPLQIGGYLSNEAVIHLSQGLSRTTFNNTGITDPSSQSNPSTTSNVVDSAPLTEFSERYGRGVRLTSDVTPDVTTPPAEQPSIAKK